jgi:hypothetical protein
LLASCFSLIIDVARYTKGKRQAICPTIK